MKAKVLVVLVCLVGLLIFPAMALSEEEKVDELTQGSNEGESQATKKEQKPFELKFDGYYRLRWTDVSHIDLRPADGRLAELHYWDTRLRLDPSLTIRPKMGILKSVTFHTLADVGDGYTGAVNRRPKNLFSNKRTWGQAYMTDSTDYKSNSFYWREFWAEADMTAFTIQVGQMGSDWARGIFANDGHDFKNDFGDAYFGDIVDRALIATKPIDLITRGNVKTDIILALAYDWLIVNDTIGNQGDNPHEFVVAVLKQPEKETGASIYHDLTVGLYFADRYQAAQTRLDALDGTLRVPVFFFDKKLKVALTLEGVYGWGKTNAAKSLLNPHTSDIRSYGYMAGLSAETKHLDLIAEIGQASGDPNASDHKITQFLFNPDYNVGLILFDQVLAAATANSAYRLANLTFGIVPDSALRLIPTQGAVSSAFYFNPRAKIRPYKGLELIVGGLYAYDPEGLIDPFLTAALGTRRNFRGGPPNKNLGWELDMGASYKYGFGKEDMYAVRVGGQGGFFWPGDAFMDAKGHALDMISLGQFRLDLLF